MQEGEGKDSIAGDERVGVAEGSMVPGAGNMDLGRVVMDTGPALGCTELSCLI